MKEPQGATWLVYPAPGTSYKGLITINEPTFIPDTASCAGQNTFDNNGDSFSPRPFGSSIVPATATASTSSPGYGSATTFRLRTGENIIVAARGANLEWYDQGTGTFNNLRSSSTSSDYGFAEFNINANAESRLYFGNGVDNFAYWNGGHTLLNGALSGGETTINVDSTASFLGIGSLRIGTTTVTYSGTTPTSFTGCAGTPAAADNLPIAQAIVEDGAAPKGNIYMTAHNRLFIVPANNRQIVMFSKYGDASSWATTTVNNSTAQSAGAFNLVEGGGQVNSMTQDEQSLYFFKDSLIYSATLTDALYSIKPLKPFDGKSRTTGARNRRGVFAGGNFIFVTTPDNQIKALQRVETIDYPQLQPISYPIQPVCDGLDFSNVIGIAFRNYAYFACKSSSKATYNDTVLCYHMIENTWEHPITGWNVADFFIYNDGNGEELYFADAISPNIWKRDTTNLSDGDYSISAYRRTKQYDFGAASEQKELDDVFIEGYISPSTSLKIKLLLDENGYSGVNETTFVGSEIAYMLDNPAVNTLAMNPLATLPIGSNNDLTGMRKFRVHLKNNLRRVPFYLAQLEFSSSGINQRWKVVRYGFLVRPHSQPTRTKLMRSFS